MMSKLLTNLYILQFVVRPHFPSEDLFLVPNRLGSLYLSMGFLLAFFALQPLISPLYIGYMVYKRVYIGDIGLNH